MLLAWHFVYFLINCHLLFLCNIIIGRRTAQMSIDNKSADFRHTLSWLTTSHNQL